MVADAVHVGTRLDQRPDRLQVALLAGPHEFYGIERHGSSLVTPAYLKDGIRAERIGPLRCKFSDIEQKLLFLDELPARPED